MLLIVWCLVYVVCCLLDVDILFCGCYACLLLFLVCCCLLLCDGVCCRGWFRCLLFDFWRLMFICCLLVDVVCCVMFFVVRCLFDACLLMWLVMS